MCPWAKGFQKNSGERETSVGITGKRDVKRGAWSDVVNVHGDATASIAAAATAFYRKESDLKNRKIIIRYKYEDPPHHRLRRFHRLQPGA